MVELGTRGANRKGACRKLSACGCARHISTRLNKDLCAEKRVQGGRPMAWLFSWLSARLKFQCPKCKHVFFADEFSTVVCPKCGHIVVRR